jgi:hypothetical protein
MASTPFQERVNAWMLECFGPAISADTVERNHRFLEEALELVQACGCTQSEAHLLVDYVFGRPAGEKFQEPAASRSPSPLSARLRQSTWLPPVKLNSLGSGPR